MIIPNSVLIIVVTRIVGLESAGVKRQGPFDLIFKYVEKCETLPTHDIDAVWKLNKLNRTAVKIQLSVSSKYEIGDDFKVRANFAMMSSQGWKNNFHNSAFQGAGICTVMRTMLPESYNAILSTIRPPVSGCPIPPGNYSFEYTVNIREVKGIPMFPYNKYRVTFSLHYPDLDSPEIACSNWYLDICPKHAPKHKKNGTSPAKPQIAE